MPRCSWHDLPPDLHRAVEARVGPVTGVQDLAAGSAAHLVSVLTTAEGQVFVKGVGAGTRAAVIQGREAAINPHLPRGCVPRLRWTVQDEGWLLHGYQYIPGRHADLSPGSGDLPLVITTLNAVCAALSPCPDLDVPVQRFADRWAGRIRAEYVEGDTLVHTDLTPRNLLVDGTRAWLVDWAGPCVGAPWISAAFLAVRLIRAGHHPRDAEVLLQDATAWSVATPEALDAFAEASARLWQQRAIEIGAPHHAPLAEAAHRWNEYRTDAKLVRGAQPSA
ncbi:hypothetical protein C8E87_1968 [Paractinoplanes brasiliensis]|uniref:Aminoglycoside phosphotransferase domain-containing protein n=1 Tax=Paractinoplanes brasiliensis TaxID=52695 RepID=A0A4R6JQP4_9ACTN|nr:hypothetical protein C8E87_1968 [Actinoplanes brasiliensis]GID26907.1 hypothetical protein Abr02nite_18900 [Actinoplanes brasiliensis]